MLKKVEVYKCLNGHIKFEKGLDQKRVCSKCGSTEFKYLGPSVVTKEENNGDNK